MVLNRLCPFYENPMNEKAKGSNINKKENMKWKGWKERERKPTNCSELKRIEHEMRIYAQKKSEINAKEGEREWNSTQLNWIKPNRKNNRPRIENDMQRTANQWMEWNGI